jgi:hypothetical protein
LVARSCARPEITRAQAVKISIARLKKQRFGASSEKIVRKIE